MTWKAILTLPAKKLTAGVITGAILASLMALSGPMPALADAPKEEGRILILNSYHPGYLFSDHEQTGILDTLRAKFPNASIRIEYLDTKNFPKPEHYKHLAEILAYKHGKDRFSVILALDNPALDFLTKFGKPLFGDTPVVFCGINNFSRSSWAVSPTSPGWLSVWTSVPPSKSCSGCIPRPGRFTPWWTTP